MRIVLQTIVLSSLCLSQLAFAQTPLTVHPSRLKCEDFLSIADKDKPALVYWVAGTERHTINPDDELIVDAASPVGLIVDECKRVPKASFIDEVKRLSRAGYLDVMAKGKHS